MNYMRNKQTGEIKEVEADSPEFIALTRQVGPDGRSLWEQTGAHHVEALAQKADADALTEEDLGAAAQPLAPIAVNTEAVAPHPAPWKELTAAEREMGQTPEAKESQVQDDINRAALDSRAQTFEEARDAIGGSTPDPEDFEPNQGGDEGQLKGKALEQALDDAGLSKSGSADEKRARLADHNAQATA